MFVSVTEFRKNLNKYLVLSLTEDIFITKNKKVISKLTSPLKEKSDISKSLFGIISDKITLEEAKEERIQKL